MTWRAMGPDRACDLVDYWAALQWPLTPRQVQDRGLVVGWDPDDEEMMLNAADALSEPAVPIVPLPSGETASLSFWATDVIRELDGAAEAFLDDQYAMLVRAGAERWGRAEQSDDSGPTAQWELPTGARVVASRGRRSVTVEFTTPQYAQVLRELGE